MTNTGHHHAAGAHQPDPAVGHRAQHLRVRRLGTNVNSTCCFRRPCLLTLPLQLSCSFVVLIDVLFACGFLACPVTAWFAANRLVSHGTPLVDLSSPYGFLCHQVGRTKRKNVFVISTDKRPVPLQVTLCAVYYCSLARFPLLCWSMHRCFSLPWLVTDCAACSLHPKLFRLPVACYGVTHTALPVGQGQPIQHRRPGSLPFACFPPATARCHRAPSHLRDPLSSPLAIFTRLDSRFHLLWLLLIDSFALLITAQHGKWNNDEFKRAKVMGTPAEKKGAPGAGYAMRCSLLTSAVLALVASRGALCARRSGFDALCVCCC